MNIHGFTPRNPRQARGAVLFVALIFLILITLLALTATSTSVLQERMTGGMRNAQVALMGADSTARGVQWSMWNASSTGSTIDCGYNATVGNTNCYSPQTTGPGVVTLNPIVQTFHTQTSWTANSCKGAKLYAFNMTGLTGAQQTASLASQPCFITEVTGRVNPPGVGQSTCQGGARLQCFEEGPGGHSLYSYLVTAISPGGNTGSVRSVESFYVAQPPSH